MGDGADGQDQLQTFYCPFQAIATVEEEEGRGWGGGGMEGGFYLEASFNWFLSKYEIIQDQLHTFPAHCLV